MSAKDAAASDETDTLAEATAGAGIGDDGEWQTSDQVSFNTKRRAVLLPYCS